MSPESSILSFQVDSEVTPEEYRLYSLIITERFSRSAREQFVIRQEVAASTLLLRGNRSNLQGRIQEWRWKLDGLSAETAHAFVQRNSEPALLEENLDLPFPYALLSEDEAADIWDWRDQATFCGQARDGWKVFRKRYPNAGPIISFSRLGFDRAKTQALVEFGVRAHWGVGGGALLLLQNSEAGWKVEKGHGLWTS